MAKIFRTPAQAVKAFYREASMEQVQCLVNEPGAGFSVVSSGTVQIGKRLGVARGFRVVVRDIEEGTRYFLDVVVVIGKRSVVTMTLESTGARRRSRRRSSRDSRRAPPASRPRRK